MEINSNIDRDDEEIEKEPTLTEMTKKALQLITKESTEKNRGFFLMVEGSRIDHWYVIQLSIFTNNS